MALPDWAAETARSMFGLISPHREPPGSPTIMTSSPDFADLPEDALNSIYTLLPAFSLRAAAASNKAWCRVLRRSPLSIRQRADWLHHWTSAGAGASIQHTDSAVCAGDGKWTPGGVVLSTTLHLTRGQDVGFRLVVEDAAPGDLLMGITLHQSMPPPSDDTALPAASDGGDGGAGGGDGGDVGVGDGGAGGAGGAGAEPSGLAPLLEMGYHFLMGRRLDANGCVQMSAAPTAPGSVYECI